jgi:hypothetical protein
VVRLPLVVLTYILTQTTTRAVVGLEEKVSSARFAILGVEPGFLGGLMLVVAEKGKKG